MEGVSKLWQSFPSAPQVVAAVFRRPHGKVSRMRNRELHCTDRLNYRSLRLCRKGFSQGWVLTGYSPQVEVVPMRFSSDVMFSSVAEPWPAQLVQVIHILT